MSTIQQRVFRCRNSKSNYSITPIPGKTLPIETDAFQVTGKNHKSVIIKDPQGNFRYIVL